MTPAHRALLVAACSLMLFAPLTAWAQDAPPGSPVTSGPVEEERPWLLYQAAFAQCTAGEREACERTLRGIVTAYPEHRAAALAASTLELLATSQPMPDPPAAIRPLDERLLPEGEGLIAPGKPASRVGASGERYSVDAMLELFAVQTLHMVAAGIELCVVLDCRDDRVSLTLVGSGSALFGAMLYFTPNAVTPGHAVALNSGTVWGAANAAMIATLADGSNEQLALSLVGGQLLGLGLGQLYYMSAEPLAGQVSLTNSGGIWTLVGFGLIGGELGLDPRSAPFGIGALAAMNGGLVVGDLLSSRFPMSRSRALLLDVGGVAGLWGGLAIYLVATDKVGGPGFFVSGLLGAGLGIGAAAHLTRDWDDTNPDVQRRLLPTVSLVPGDSLYTARGERQGGWGLSASWVW